jgi:hypothetical protein
VTEKEEMKVGEMERIVNSAINPQGAGEERRVLFIMKGGNSYAA